jgi:hypothetical protein
LEPEDEENGFSEDTSYEGYVEGKGYPIYKSDGKRIGYGSFDEYQDTLHWFEEAPSIWVYSANFYNDCIFAYVFDKYCQEKQAVLIHIDSELKITGYEVF